MDLPNPEVHEKMLVLSSFLSQIKEELHIQAQSLSSDHWDHNQLDEFLWELNNYYYQSFHERFIPLYRAQWEKEIKRLYGIARDESALKEDIIKNLKRSAQIYNQVKNGLNLLKCNHEQIYNLRFMSGRSQEQLLLELIYALKETEITLAECLDLLYSCQTLVAEKELLKSIKVYPFQSILKNLWNSWDSDNSTWGRDYKRLMINLELCVKLLGKISGSDEKHADDWDTWLAELYKTEHHLSNKKYSPALNEWYRQDLRPQFILYTELLALNIRMRERKGIQANVRHFENWLQALLYLLERTNRRNGRPEPLLLEMYYANSADAAFLKEIIELLSKAQKNLQVLIKQHGKSANPEFTIFREAAGGFLHETWPTFKNMIKTNPMNFSLLGNMLVHMRNQFCWLETQIDHLDNQAEHIQKTQRQYEQILDTISSYQNALTEMKNQLAKTLAPRNLSRQFKDFEVRVEHVPLNQGEPFPSPYLDLLDHGHAKTGQGFIIEEEDGDLFIFRLGDLKDALVPNIKLREG